ncbi:MAG: MFS transporter [Microbacterium sp.]
MRGGVLRFLPLGLALLCVQLDFFSLNLALPVIADAVHSTVTDLQWLVSGYVLSLGAFLVPAGRIGDIIGRRATLFIGLGVFAATSLVAGFATTSAVLIPTRIVQGLGAALIMPTVFVIVSHTVVEDRRAKVVAFLLAVAGIGTATGPVVGGLFAQTIGWQWVFWINVPFAVVAGIGLLFLDDPRSPSAAPAMDWWGLVTVVAGLALLSIGIDRIPETGWLSPTALPLVVGGVVVLGLFAWIESRTVAPLVRPALFGIRPYRFLLLLGFVCNGALNVLVYLAAIDLQVVDGFSATTAGMLFVPGSIGVAISGPVGGWLCGRFAPSAVLAVAAVCGGGSLALAALSPSLWAFLLALGVAGCACGLGYSVAQAGVQTAVPVSHASEANSFLLMTLIALGGIVVVTAANVTEALSPTDVPSAGAIDAALYGTAALLVVAGVVAGLTLRRVRPAGAADPSLA